MRASTERYAWRGVRQRVSTMAVAPLSAARPIPIWLTVAAAIVRTITNPDRTAFRGRRTWASNEVSSRKL